MSRVQIEQAFDDASPLKIHRGEGYEKIKNFIQ